MSLVHPLSEETIPATEAPGPQPPPIVDRRRLSIEERFDALLRETPGSISEVVDRSRGTIGETEDQVRYVVEPFLTRAGRGLHLEIDDRGPDQEPRQINEVTGLPDDASTPFRNVVTPVVPVDMACVHRHHERDRPGRRRVS